MDILGCSLPMVNDMDELTGNTPGKRLRGEEARAHYARLLDEQETSGLTVVSFAAERGLSAATLYMWRRRLGRSAGPTRRVADREENLGFVSVEVLGSGEGNSAASKGYELELVDGRRLRIPSDYDREALSTLMSILKC